MNAGLRTRNKLMDAVRYPAKSGHKALHPDIHGDIVDVPQPADRRGTTIFGYKKYRDDEEIPEVTYLPNAHGLGTPLEAERTRAIRREQLYDKAFRFGGAIIVILVAFGGYGYVARRDQPVSSGVAYYIKAQGLRVGQRACELDQHEGCLVCMHRETSGMTLVSHHC